MHAPRSLCVVAKRMSRQSHSLYIVMYNVARLYIRGVATIIYFFFTFTYFFCHQTVCMPPVFIALPGAIQVKPPSGANSDCNPSEVQFLSCRPCARCQRRTGCWCDHCEEDFEELNDNEELMSGRALCHPCEQLHSCCPSCESEDRPRLQPRCSVCNSPSRLRCGRCKDAKYCSRTCQVRAWDNWHKGASLTDLWPPYIGPVLR